MNSSVHTQRTKGKIFQSVTIFANVPQKSDINPRFFLFRKKKLFIMESTVKYLFHASIPWNECMYEYVNQALICKNIWLDN